MAATLNLVGPDKAAKTHDLVLEIAFKKNATEPRDLTGAVIRLTISSFGQNKFVASTSNGRITVPTPTNGKAFLRITAAELNTIPSGTHRYVCVIIQDGNTEAVIEESQIEIS